MSDKEMRSKGVQESFSGVKEYRSEGVKTIPQLRESRDKLA